MQQKPAESIVAMVLASQACQSIAGVAADKATLEYRQSSPLEFSAISYPLSAMSKHATYRFRRLKAFEKEPECLSSDEKKLSPLRRVDSSTVRGRIPSLLLSLTTYGYVHEGRLYERVESVKSKYAKAVQSLC